MMTPAQYRKALEKLNLTMDTAHIALGISHRQSWRYASGETAVPAPIEKLLKLMLETD